MAVLKKYLFFHIKSVLLFLLFSVICAVVFGLYSLPLAAVAYAVLLCLFVGLLLAIPDYRAFCRRHLLLQQLRQEIYIDLAHLPNPLSLLEADYQQLLQIQHADKNHKLNELSNQHNEQIEYYSLWAHQIKTPISAMRLLIQSGTTPDKKELLEELQRIEQYVEMALCYLRLNSESTDYVLQNYDLDAIVRQAVKKYAAQFIRRRIVLDYQPLDCCVLTDEKWLLFVIEQLLSNALKYTRSGSIRIYLEQPCTLCIADSGIGIAAEDLPRIFDKGFTGYNGREDKKSTGIGLYLCRCIIDKLGHRLTITSAQGQGTLVRIMLDQYNLELND